MKIGCPKEIKPQEFRVGMTPNAVREASLRGHAVMVETGAGLGAGFTDADYLAAGAEISLNCGCLLHCRQMGVEIRRFGWDIVSRET